MEIPDDLIHANFFFVDIIGLSDPFLSTESQRNKISILYEYIKNCSVFQKTSCDEKLILPTGDALQLDSCMGWKTLLNLLANFNKN